MENSIDVYAVLLNLVIFSFILAAFVGIYIKLNSMFMAALAYPTYIALYSIEFFIGINKKNEASKHFFRLNIPKENPKRYITNIIASGITLLCTLTGYSFIMSFIHPDRQKIFLDMLYNGMLVGKIEAGFIIFMILIIYLISWSCEVDNRLPIDKIESLSIPSLWKSVIKID